MRITGGRQSDPLKVYAQTRPQPKNKAGREGHPSDEVSISEHSKELQRAMQAMEQAPDANRDRLSQIRSSVQDGSYDVRGEEVAAAILRRAARRGDMVGGLSNTTEDSQ